MKNQENSSKVSETLKVLQMLADIKIASYEAKWAKHSENEIKN